MLDETHTGTSYRAVSREFRSNESKYVLNQVSSNKAVGEAVDGNAARGSQEPSAVLPPGAKARCLQRTVATQGHMQKELVKGT